MFGNANRIEDDLIYLKQLHAKMGRIPSSNEIGKLWHEMGDLLNEALTEDQHLKQHLIIDVDQVLVSLEQVKETLKNL